MHTHTLYVKYIIYLPVASPASLPVATSFSQTQPNPDEPAKEVGHDIAIQDGDRCNSVEFLTAPMERHDV